MPFGAIQAAFFTIGTIRGTKSDDTNESEIFGMIQDSTIKKPFPYRLAVLRDRKGDLSKEWFIEWYAFDEHVNDLVRKRKKIPLSFHDKKSRTAEANRLIGLVNKALASGFHFKKPVVESDQETEKRFPDDLIQTLNSVIQLLRPTLAVKTVFTYESAVNKFELFSAANRPTVTKYTTKDALHFRDYLITTLNNSARTANNTLSHLAVVFSHYLERAGTGANPFKIKALKQPATEKNIAFTDEDRIKVEEYLIEKEPELYLLTRFIYQAFIRPGELLKIRIKDINTEQKFIKVHGLISKNGKTETALMIPPLHQLIMKTVDFSKPDKFLFSLSMFPGYTVCAKQVPFRRHEKVLKELGLLEKGYTLYSWKHTGAVNAYRAGVGIKELQNMLRHSSVQITDIYLKSLGLRTDPKQNSYSW